MRVVILSSGSKGNTTFVECNGYRFLIDMGNTCKYVVSKLSEIGVDPSSLNGIFISHTHKDHISGLNVFLKKYDVPVYLTLGKLKELDFVNNYIIIDSDRFYVDDICIDVIKTSHDSIESMGFIISYGGFSMVQITDTGYINQKYFDILKNRDIYVMESNHDVEMLMNGPYPPHLKARVLSDKGHLSNYDSARYLSEFIGDNTKYVVLAHISEFNNTYDLAFCTLKERLINSNINFDSIIVAEQLCMSDVIEI